MYIQVVGAGGIDRGSLFAHIKEYTSVSSVSLG